MIAVDVFYAVAYRYPGASTDKDTAREALNFSQEVRQAVRLSFDLTPEKARSRSFSETGWGGYIWFSPTVSKAKPGWEEKKRDRVIFSPKPNPI